LPHAKSPHLYHEKALGRLTRSSPSLKCVKPAA
jgi:hypothetical protein